jgi:hypothetical protein
VSKLDTAVAKIEVIVSGTVRPLCEQPRPPQYEVVYTSLCAIRGR